MLRCLRLIVLVWKGKARSGGPFDLAALVREAPSLSLLPLAPVFYRHPLEIADPTLLDPVTVRLDGQELWVERPSGPALPIDLDRLPAYGDLDKGVLTASTALWGLLRFDQQRWSFQPLVSLLRSGKKEKVIMQGEGAMAVLRKDKLKMLETLQERAGKLLRSKPGGK